MVSTKQFKNLFVCILVFNFFHLNVDLDYPWCTECSVTNIQTEVGEKESDVSPGLVVGI